MIKKEYEVMYNVEKDFWWYKGNRQIIKAIIDNLASEERSFRQKKEQKTIRILDAGCGTGMNMLFLSELFKLPEKGRNHIFGIDYSDEAIRLCKKRVFAITKGSVEDLPYKNSEFDLVTSFEVIYHKGVEDDINALKEMERVCKSGGYVVVRVPAYRFLFSEHDIAVQTKRRYTRKELEEKIIKAGLKIQRITYANTIMFPTVSIVRLAKNAMGAKNKREEKIESDLKKISPLVNKILTKILSIESMIIKHINFPFGTSIIAIAKKE